MTAARHLKILCIAILSLFVSKVWAQNSNSSMMEGYQVTPKGAWCWFADPRALHHENAQLKINKSYIGYIDVQGNIKAMQYDFVRKQQVEVLIRSWFQPDDHNNPTFLILPDERVMIFYSRHTDERCFYYRVSQKPGDITTLGEEKMILTDHPTTYPSAFILTADPEHIYLCWRGIKWHPTIAKLSLPDHQDEVKIVYGPYQMVQSTGARPYAKYMSNGKDKIYMTYTTGHPDNEIPNLLYFNYINIKTGQLMDVHETVLSTIDKGPFQINKNSSYIEKYPQTIVDNPSSERDWVWQMTADKMGAPVIALVRINADKTSHDYYHAKWTGQEWKTTFLSNAGGHFHQTANLEMCYSAGMAIDPNNSNIIYCSLPVNGKNGQIYEIIKYELDKDGNIVSKTPVTQNSSQNNIRPYIIPGSENSALRLTWMYGEYYDWIVSKSRSGYPTAIHSDFKGFSTSTDLRKGLIVKKKADLKIGKNYSIVTSIRLDTVNYAGTIVKIGDLVYNLNTTTGKPELQYKGKVYPSTNVLGTADAWKKVNRGTNGKWHRPEKLTDVKLALTYDKGIVRTYINGLLDQTIVIGKVNWKNATITSPHHQLIDSHLYKRALEWSEINELTNTGVK